MRRGCTVAGVWLSLSVLAAACSGGDGNGQAGTERTDSDDAAATGLPPPVPGEVVAQLRRPAHNLRWDGRHLYATGIPYTFIRIDRTTGEAVELPFGRAFGDTADGAFATNTVIDGEVAMVVNETGPGDDRLLVPDVDTGDLRSVDLPFDEFLMFPPSVDEAGVVIGFTTGDVAPVTGRDGSIGGFVTVPGVTALTAPVRHDTSVWLAAPDDSAVVELDAADLSLRRRIDVAPLPNVLAVHDDTLWVGHAAGPSLTEVDLETGAILEEIDLMPDDPRATPTEVEPVLATVDDRLFARVGYSWDGQPVAVIAEIDTDAGAVSARRTVAAGIASLGAVDGELLVLDSAGRIVSVDLERFTEDDDRSAPMPSPFTFRPTGTEQAAIDAFSTVYDPRGDPEAVTAGIEGDLGSTSIVEDAFAALVDDGIESFEPVAAAVDGDRAWVSFDALDPSGRRIVTDDTAALVLVDGDWKVPRAQVCMDLSVVGVECP